MSAKKPLFAFFGTPDFAIAALGALEARGFLPALVITTPDKPRGRGLATTPTPVGAWAAERGIDTLAPASLKDGVLADELKNTDWDLFIVAAYGKILPKNILDIPRKGCLNIHPSLLPKFRGPSPIISTILADEPKTGVSIIKIGEGLDDGPVVAQASIEVEEQWPLPAALLAKLLFTEGGNLLADTIPLWLEDTITPEVQDESKATFTKKFIDADAKIDLAGNPREQFLKIRAFDQNPRAHFFVNNKRIIITDAEFADGELKITKVIPEGKKEMGYEEFLRNAAK